jgi:hypothetical protein
MADEKPNGKRLRRWLLLAVVLIVTGVLGIVVGVLSIEYDLRLRSLLESGQSAAPNAWATLADAWRRYSSNWISAGFRICLVMVGLLTVLYGFRGERQPKTEPVKQVA